MEIARPYCCEELKNKTVIDSTGKKIGHISDLTFIFDRELKIVHFKLTGPLWEEFLEAIHLRSDRNRVFDSSVIKKIDEHIHLDISGNQLLTTMNKNTISDDEVKFSELEKLDIFDKNQEKIGRAIDVDLDTDNRVSIIVGGGFVEEKLEAIGLKDDVDIIVPSNVISSIHDSIQLSVSKDELDTSLNGILKEKAMEIQQAREAARDHRSTRKERVVTFWPYVSK
jgi:sporulation protein YlmC with PRC-barrel domain